MTWTLSTLKTAIQDYSESTESSFVTNLPNFIKTAEERILKGVQLDDFIKNVTGTATASSAYLGAPSDFLSSFSLAVIDGSSNYNYLQLKHPSFIRDFTPASSTTGLPKYYDPHPLLRQVILAQLGYRLMHLMHYYMEV